MSDLVVNTEKTFTYEDYLKLEDNQDYEVVGGKLILVPKPMPYHQEIVGRLITELNIFLRQNPLGKVYSDVDVVLRDQVVSPDLIFIAKDRLSIITETNIKGPPDLAIEVLSPSTHKYDRKQKSQLYHANGIKEYWIVDPALQLVEVFIAGKSEWNRSGVYDEGDILTSPLLSELRIELKNVF
jgi:Uma2 family endonuclease